MRPADSASGRHSKGRPVVAAFLWESSICDGGKEKTLNVTARFFFFVLVVGAAIGSAQTPGGAAVAGAQTQIAPAGTTTDHADKITLLPGKYADNPVAQVREARSWEYGPFVNYGNGLGDRSSFKFLSAGMQLAKPLTPVFHAGIFSGQFELGANIMPLWQAYTPAPHYQNYTCAEPVGGKPTPVLCRLAAAPSAASVLPR